MAMAFFECSSGNTIRPIKNLLIANRGEIASRIAKSARKYSISPRGVYSLADSSLSYVEEMDEAYCIGDSHPSTSYLAIEKIIRAAIAMGCDAVAPGYGFLSENAAFAQAVIEADLTFVGPPPRVIAALGSKSRAKEIAALARVPVLDSHIISSDTILDDKLLSKISSSIEGPYLIKAVYGGGGRGMRLVNSLSELLEEIRAAQREALSAFGDSTLYIESYIEEPRHIEVQIVADNYGNVATLFERECSIQRRFQKVIEEAPSPSIDDEVRSGLFSATKALAEAIGYSNLGTAEFVVTRDDRFYFLEVNTRLQVEHRVTEAITGIDLVGVQLEMAMGYSLPRALLEANIEGHAIEARIYGESTHDGFMPSSGKITSIDLDHFDVVDQSYYADDQVSIYYDSMIAKVVTQGSNREQAILKLKQGLLASHVTGVSTNIALLRGISQDQIFIEGMISTNYIGRFLEENPAKGGSSSTLEAVIPAAIYFIDRANKRRAHLRNLPASYRNLPSKSLSINLVSDELETTIRYRCDRQNRVTLELGEDHYGPYLFNVTSNSIVLELDGLRKRYTYSNRGEVVAISSPSGCTSFTKVSSQSRKSQLAAGSLTTKMAGTITKVMVDVGDSIRAGEVIAVIEAMKIEQPIVAPLDGIIDELFVVLNQRIDRGVKVATITPLSDDKT